MLRILTLAAAIALGLSGAASAQWKPNKPVRIIVPWGPGGSTDQLVRALAAEIEGALGQTVVVVNQAGGAGAVGTKATLDAPHDGYTWTAGATKDLGTYIVTGAVSTQLKDWELYLGVVNYTVLSVNPNSKFKSVQDIAAAMKSAPATVTIATGGINSAGGASSEAIKAAVGGDYKMVTYDSGNAAVQAAVSGETQITTQLIAEQFQMLRAKKLKPLAAFTDQDVTIEGIGTIPSLKKALPKVAAGPVHFGIWIPKDAPKEVIETMNKVWDGKIKTSDRLKKYAESAGLTVLVLRGDAAYKAAFPVVQINAWAIHNGGKSKVSPDTVGIPKPN
ncbi:MAG TPA: tripartite tricarboxylate transporter substrate binding protein [Pseudolabrys sp.]|nr:tripartite tricarboxylate transporter substrate binding protein [Pseudolabrys sp.]